MASSSTSSKKNKQPKPPKGRPQATSQISQPVVQDSSALTALSAFSLSRSYYAYLSLAVDKHRLRVYDTLSGQSIAEHTFDSARVTSLAWCRGLSREDSASSTSPRKKKKRRKSQNNVSSITPESLGPEEVVLGLSDGVVHFFSVVEGKISHTFSSPSCTSSIIALAPPIHPSDEALWTSDAHGSIHRWNVQTQELSGSWKPASTPYSSISVRPSSSAVDDVELLAANHSVKLLSLSSPSEKPDELMTFTGHASSINTLQWDLSHDPPTRFITSAVSDRFIYLWQAPEDQSITNGRIVASVPLDADVRQVQLSIPPGSPDSPADQTLLTVSASGRISIFPVPSEITGEKKQAVPTLLARSSISVSTKKGGSTAVVINAAFLADKGRIVVARLVNGVQIIFDRVDYLNESGDFISEINLIKDDTLHSVGVSQGTPGNKRYNEHDAAIQSGLHAAQDPSMDIDGPAAHEIDGELDVDIAELSLGQRLAALPGSTSGTGKGNRNDDDDDDEGSDSEAAPTGLSRKGKKKDASFAAGGLVPAASLTRTLIQALHSSDDRLLETCLGHSEQGLIRNTVQKLPPQLAVPLLNACMARLGRGGRGGQRGAGASAQRGTGTVRWVNAVLAVHCGSLLTMPDLVARLAGLHATLTTRLALQESLLTLSGRLDMVLSQIDTRAPTAPAAVLKSKSNQKAPAKYVEGESEDEEDDAMDIEVEHEDDDERSVENIELGGNSDDEEESGEGESDDDEEDDDEDEEDSDDEGGGLSGFIDDEAEEFSGDEDEDASDDED